MNKDNYFKISGLCQQLWHVFCTRLNVNESKTKKDWRENVSTSPFLPGGEGAYDRKCTFERKTNGFGGKNIGQDNEVK